MPTLMAPLDEAREHLRVIRQTMERSTKYSTLSGLSGVLIGLVAIVGVVVTNSIIRQAPAFTVRSQAELRSLNAFQHRQFAELAAIWTTVLVLAIAIDFVANKRRAARVGKTVCLRLAGISYSPPCPHSSPGR